MKRILCFLGLLAAVLLACTLPSTVTPPAMTQPPAGASATVSPVTPIPVTPLPQANVTCNNVSLYLEPSLASGFKCTSVPEVSGAEIPAFAANPQYTEITLQGYVLSGRFFDAHIDIYPVQRYNEVAPDANIPTMVTMLQGLTAGGLPGSDALPVLPVFNAAQELHVLYKVVPFGSGSGIRFLTQYAQFADPINNHELFYTYQGLTADGRYWISAILPTSLADLPADGNTPPAGQSPEQFSNSFTTYLADMTTKLNGQAEIDFSPAVPALDALVSSLQVAP